MYFGNTSLLKAETPPINRRRCARRVGEALIYPPWAYLANSRNSASSLIRPRQVVGVWLCRLRLGPDDGQHLLAAGTRLHHAAPLGRLSMDDPGMQGGSDACGEARERVRAEGPSV